MLFTLIESALPTDLIKNWERQRNTSTYSDLNLMIDFAKNEVETEVRIKIKNDVLSTEKVNVKKNKYSEPKCGIPTAYELLNSNNSKSSSNLCEN